MSPDDAARLHLTDHPPTLEASMTRKLFVNLPVSDLKRSIDCFMQLGFTAASALWTWEAMYMDPSGMSEQSI